MCRELCLNKKLTCHVCQEDGNCDLIIRFHLEQVSDIWPNDCYKIRGELGRIFLIRNLTSFHVLLPETLTKNPSRLKAGSGPIFPLFYHFLAGRKNNPDFLGINPQLKRISLNYVYVNMNLLPVLEGEVNYYTIIYQFTPNQKYQ